PAQFYLTFSSAARKTSKDAVQLSENQIDRLQAVQPAFNASTWTVDELSRVVFMSCLPTENNQVILDKLFDTADMRESVALFKGIYFLDNAEEFILRSIDGLRTNITPVFDAIALDNVFPSLHFEEAPWNQMVLKAIFMQRPIYRIYDLDKRRNKTLALILQDYAHERWSAHREVSPELWRAVAGYADESFLPDFEKMLKSDVEIEQFAASKAIIESELPQAKSLLQGLNKDLEHLPSWDEIGKRWEQENSKQ
ncbi:MAG: EboA domain-containing protein, partial [Saprospiraceae bacterium]|nr:EboA domain-containing protein [Saprospiraceae bacterium]